MKKLWERSFAKGSAVSAPFLTAVLVFVNILLLTSAIVLYSRYTAVYKERLTEENLGNINNLNQSAADSATAMLQSWFTKISDIAVYCERHEMDVTEALTYIEESNSDSQRYFQLVRQDYSGYAARRDSLGAFVPVSYQSSSYGSMKAIFSAASSETADDIAIAPEFTDSVSADKYFAVYRYIPLYADGAREYFTLLLGAPTTDVLQVFNKQPDFDGQSTVLAESGGDYLVSSNDFKSTNFFKYLYLYNDLTLEQRNEVSSEMNSNVSGELYFKNALSQDCVFSYMRMSANDWFCITCVPIASFRTPILSINYDIYAICALLLLMLVDAAWLLYTNQLLKQSMLSEKEASSAKTDFLSRMSHDIRTPLNGIIGLSALAVEEANPPTTQEYLENIRVSGQFLLGLVNDILDMSKVESGKVELAPEPYYEAELGKYVQAVIAPLCREKGLQLQMTEPSSRFTLLLDRLRFNQVVFNLLSNAVKYTPSGGLVELYWNCTVLSPERAELVVTIRDNGIGMSEEFQKHMFEAFTQERGSTAASGTGLGLSIVRSLVDLMGGRIEVQSTQGKGTTMKVILQAALGSEQTPEVEEEAGFDLNGVRVLLCEDNHINVLFVERLLAKWGMIVDTAGNGREGVERFSASAEGYYQLILMDVQMPEMNGLEASRTIRELAREDAKTIPIIAMTANAYDSDIENCLSAGMNAHVCKPFEPSELSDLMKKLLSKQI